jgi:FKBP-type peptidyl-prolyl cis-trans isomerase 2
MTLQKKDFIEIEFTGRIKDGGIFDSNIKQNLEKLNPNENPKPLIFCLDEGMFLKGIDDFLIGKEIGKYTVELSPENAFGPRVKEFVQMIPSRIFKEQKLNPFPGAVFNFDGRIAKVLSVSGGRIMVDFNNPLAGKNVVYEINVLRKVEDMNEKAKALLEFLFRREIKFSVDEKEKKVTVEVEKNFSKLVEMFKEKFKEVIGFDLEIKELGDSKETDKEIEDKSEEKVNSEIQENFSKEAQ